MNLENVIDFLCSKNISFERDFSTAKLSYLELGGSAGLIVYPKSKAELCEVLDILSRECVRHRVIGNCSNVFFASSGFDGAIICTKFLRGIEIAENQLIAECGALVTDCSVMAMGSCLCGMEFLCGIPGSVGGAIYMNSCAYDGKISGVVYECEAYDALKGELVRLNGNELCFGDKKSIFSSRSNLVILSAKFNLEFKDKNFIKQRMLEISLKRIKSQPLEFGSCGSTFKRPKNTYASKLIDELNLKGTKIGGAMISPKHAGFIVNFDNASDANILALINLIKSKVEIERGVQLEQEIIFVE